MAIEWTSVVPPSPDAVQIKILKEIGGELYAGTGIKAKLLKLSGGSWQTLTSSNDMGGGLIIQGIHNSTEIGEILCSAESRSQVYDPIGGDWKLPGTPTIGWKGVLFDKPSTGLVFFGGWATNDRWLHSWDGTLFGMTILNGQTPVGEYIRANIVHNGNLFWGTALGSLYEYDGAFGWILRVSTNGEFIKDMIVFAGKLYAITDAGKLYEYDEVSAWILRAPVFSGKTDLRAMVEHNSEIYASTGDAWVLKWNGVDAWTAVADTTESFGIDTLVSFGGNFYGGSDSSSDLLELQLVPIPPIPTEGLTPQIALFGIFMVADALRSSLISTYGWLLWEELASIIITDYCARNKERIIEQFEDKPLLLGLMCSLVTPLQELEFVYDDLYTKRWLDSSEGVQLDGIGDIVGLSRQGLNDEEYRNGLRFQISVNMSNGEWETMISVTKELTNATIVRIQEMFPAGIHLFTDGATIPINLIQLLEQSAPAGVKLTVSTTYLELPQFAYQIETATPDPDGGGYAEPTESGTGGHYAERIL